jgi:hypothetical protein
MKITLVIEPPPLPPTPFEAGPERFQPFASELGRHANTAVAITDEITPRSLPDGFVLWVTGGDPERLLERFAQPTRDDLAARTVLMSVSWQKALEQLEEYGFAAAVDSLRFNHWAGNPSAPPGLFALRELAAETGATCAALSAFGSKRYCLLESDHHHGLPHLLADYLAAYERSRKPLGEVKPLPVDALLGGGVRGRQE